MRNLNGRVAKLEAAMKPDLTELARRARELLRQYAAGLLSPEKEAAARRVLELLEIARQRRDRK